MVLNADTRAPAYVDIGDAHQAQQLLAVLVVLPRDPDQPPAELVNVLLVAVLLGYGQVLLSVCAALPTLVQLAALQLWRFAVKHVPARVASGNQGWVLYVEADADKR